MRRDLPTAKQSCAYERCLHAGAYKHPLNDALRVCRPHRDQILRGEQLHDVTSKPPRRFDDDGSLDPWCAPIERAPHIIRNVPTTEDARHLRGIVHRRHPDAWTRGAILAARQEINL